MRNGRGHVAVSSSQLFLLEFNEVQKNCYLYLHSKHIKIPRRRKKEKSWRLSKQINLMLERGDSKLKVDINGNVVIRE